MMIYDNQIRFLGALLHGGDEALPEIGALLSCAGISPRVHSRPELGIVWQKGELGSVAGTDQPRHAETLAPAVRTDGVIRVKSAYPVAETIARLKQEIAAKGIKFFDEIDEAKLVTVRKPVVGAGIRVTIGQERARLSDISENRGEVGFDLVIQLNIEQIGNPFE